MRSRVQRWTSLALCSVLCSGLSLVALAGTSDGAGAATPADLTVSGSPVSFGSVTLGNHSVLQVSVTNTSASPEVITGYANTGPNADDFCSLPRAGLHGQRRIPRHHSCQ